MAETIREYLDTVQEQIRWKRARPVVVRELEQHLTDQRDAFLEEGSAPEEAERLAVEEMGDPVSAGTELDRVHRPKPQWGLLATTLALALLGGFMRGGALLPVYPFKTRKMYKTETMFWAFR